MKKICIVGGAGHIGFPLGLYLSSKKNSVYLYDKNQKSCRIINSSKSPHYEENVNEFIKSIGSTTKLVIMWNLLKMQML